MGKPFFRLLAFLLPLSFHLPLSAESKTCTCDLVEKATMKAKSELEKAEKKMKSSKNPAQAFANYLKVSEQSEKNINEAIKKCTQLQAACEAAKPPALIAENAIDGKAVDLGAGIPREDKLTPVFQGTGKIASPSPRAPAPKKSTAPAKAASAPKIDPKVAQQAVTFVVVGGPSSRLSGLSSSSPLLPTESAVAPIKPSFSIAQIAGNENMSMDIHEGYQEAGRRKPASARKANSADMGADIWVPRKISQGSNAKGANSAASHPTASNASPVATAAEATKAPQPARAEEEPSNLLSYVPGFIKESPIGKFFWGKPAPAKREIASQKPRPQIAGMHTDIFYNINRAYSIAGSSLHR